ncbi:MAG: TRAP transporter large permease [Xanthobacteraceae bacterium]|nr:TRAP transporter large permease [Xanthobacteraceae bacterium]
MIGFAFSTLVVLIALSLPVAAVLGLLGYLLSERYAFVPMTGALGEVAWNTSNDFILIAAPMFIMMGELMHRSGLSERLFTALAPWFNRLPGRLIHTNIATCAVFAATSGSSVATAATIGTVAIPNMERGGYSRPLFLGSIAAGGTLGILIPPSINMIIYGVLTDTSVTRLYAAGFVPGFLMAGLFSALVLGLCLARPAWGGAALPEPDIWRLRLRGLVHLVPPLILFFLVVGSIYVGLATPTEAAALGLMATLALVWLNGELTLPVLLRAFEGTVRTTSMVMLIVIAAFFLNLVIVSIGLVKTITDTVLGLGLSPYAMLLAIVAFYVVLGCFMETISMMIATTPVVVPVLVALGFDPLWWGVVFVILMEMALITPPVGLNLFVVQAVRGRGAFAEVGLGALPFVAIMIVMIALLMLFPGLALWLPAVLHPQAAS